MISGRTHRRSSQADGYPRGRWYERECIGTLVPKVGSSVSAFVDSKVLVLPPKLLHAYLTVLPISDRDEFGSKMR